MQATDTVSPPTPSPEMRPPRASATLVVVRDSAQGIEVLLSRRAERGDHNSGAWVFPGGIVDPGDALARDACVGLDEAAANARLGVAHGALSYYVAAVRECFEESGLLYATDARGEVVRLDDESAAGLRAWRGPLHRNERTIGALCEAFGLKLALDRLVYLSHWLTPLGRAKRFDTRFFLAVLPPGQESRHDEVETVEQVWLRPAEALSPENSRRLMTPTRAMIEQVGRFDSIEALLAWARSPREVRRVLPLLPVEPPR